MDSIVCYVFTNWNLKLEHSFEILIFSKVLLLKKIKIPLRILYL